MLDRLAGGDGVLYASRKDHVVKQLEGIPGYPGLFQNQVQIGIEIQNLMTVILLHRVGKNFL